MITQHLRRSTYSAAIFAIALITALAGIGCGGVGDQTPAIKKAIETHLSQRSDLAINQMTMDVQTVTVAGDKEGDKAQAEVVFRVTSDPNMQMGYHYELVRESGAWKVTGGQPSQADTKHPAGNAGGSEGMNEMGGAAALPPGHPPLPEGNAPMSGNPHESGALPQGHPPLSNNP